MMKMGTCEVEDQDNEDGRSLVTVTKDQNQRSRGS